MSLTLGVEVRLLRVIQAIVVRNDVSRQLGEVFLSGARKTYIPDDPSTLFDFELGDEHLLREEVGHRVRSRPSEEGTTKCQGRPPLISIALRQSQMDIFDFISFFPWEKPWSHPTRRHGSGANGMAGGGIVVVVGVVP